MSIGCHHHERLHHERRRARRRGNEASGRVGSVLPDVDVLVVARNVDVARAAVEAHQVGSGGDGVLHLRRQLAGLAHDLDVRGRAVDHERHRHVVARGAVAVVGEHLSVDGQQRVADAVVGVRGADRALGLGARLASTHVVAERADVEPPEVAAIDAGDAVGHVGAHVRYRLQLIHDRRRRRRRSNPDAGRRQVRRHDVEDHRANVPVRQQSRGAAKLVSDDRYRDASVRAASMHEIKVDRARSGAGAVQLRPHDRAIGSEGRLRDGRAAPCRLGVPRIGRCRHEPHQHHHHQHHRR